MDAQTRLRDQEELVKSLQRVLGEHGRVPELFETHISWVLVGPEHAYKIKKAVRFDFLDFSALEARHFFCEEEVRLNRRLAPSLYLGVVPMTGSAREPRIGGAGAALEYAVSMRSFPQDALWSTRIGQGSLSAGEIDALAAKLALFHAGAARAPLASSWGSAEAMQKIGNDNIALLAASVRNTQEAGAVETMRAWQNARRRSLGAMFAQRKEQGFVRECHGDLHSGNILTIDGQVEVFDCIEFSDTLRWIDVMNDLAFIGMDLRLHGRSALAARLINGYLEASGDYAGLPMLRYYETECALVRWKIALLRAGQAGAGQRASAGTFDQGVRPRSYRVGSDPDALAGDAVNVHDGTGVRPHPATSGSDPLAVLAGAGQAAPNGQQRQADQLMAFALAEARPARGAVIALHGFAGSGKSTLARHLVELLGAVQIRSDVERKRMHGIAPAAPAPAPPGAGLYDAAATEATYARLRMLAAAVAGAGVPVLVDAGFLARRQRRQFDTLAAELGVPFLLIDLQAREATLRERIAARARQGGDPSDAGLAVLAHQLAQHEPLEHDEAARALRVDSEAAWDPEALRLACMARMQAAPEPPGS